MKGYIIASAVSRRRSCCHCEECRYVSNIKSDNIIKFNSLEQALKTGYRKCKECFGYSNSTKHRKKIIEKACKKECLSFTFAGNVVFINTLLSQWYFNIYDKQPVVFHKNIENTRKFLNEYHAQKDGKRFKSCEDAINYIARHDRRMQYGGPRNAMEKRIYDLLNMINVGRK